MRWIEIPHFTSDESIVVEQLFREAGIECEKRTLQIGMTRHRAILAYTFLVREEQFRDAITLLKRQIGIAEGPEPYSGICPACGCAIAAAMRCPDCDLNLSGDYGEVEPQHPFLVFLKREGLL